LGIAITLLSLAWSGGTARAECRVERQATLPVTFNGFMPTVAAVINGQTVAIGIDTGSQGTIVTPETVKVLNLPRDPSHFTTAYGTGGRTWVNNAVLDKLEFAGVAYAQKSVPVIALGQPLIAVGQSPANVVMAGLVGTDVLSHYDLDFNVPERTITLYRVTDCTRVVPPWVGSYATVPVLVTGSRRLVLPIEIDGFPLRAIFDTGASGMLLALSSGSRVGVTAEMLVQDSWGGAFGKGGSDRNVPSYRFDRVRVGGEILHGLRIGVMDFPASEADMLIGEDYMHAHRFWLSYATQTLFIQSDGGHASAE
jgi:predicted aspartyl protease